MVTIDIVEKIISEGRTYLIAECNLYEDGVIIRQYSRTPFDFDGEWTDEQLIIYLRDNEYKQYFPQ